MDELFIGPFVVRAIAGTEPVDGETPSGSRASGIAHFHGLFGPDGLHLTLRDAHWANGERDIVAVERHQSPERFDTLVGRLRLAVLDRDGGYIELQQSRLRPGGRAGLFKARLQDLDGGAGLDVRGALLAAGAESVGTREQLLGDSERTRTRMGARFGEAGRITVPLVAYVLTRVAPLSHGIAA
jgi:hypothetical protein